MAKWACSEGGPSEHAQKVALVSMLRGWIHLAMLQAIHFLCVYMYMQDTQRLASYGMRSQQRVEELESGIERLRNLQESLRRKLKQQAEKKTRLEASHMQTT